MGGGRSSERERIWADLDVCAVPSQARSMRSGKGRGGEGRRLHNPEAHRSSVIQHHEPVGQGISDDLNGLRGRY